MVVVNRVTKFVQQDKVAQFFGQSHQEEAERDTITRRATPPLRAGRGDREVGITQSRSGCKACQACRKVALRGTAQLFDLLPIGRWRSGGLSLGQPLLCPHDPRRLSIEEGQRLFDPHRKREGQTHLPRRVHGECHPSRTR